MRGLQYTFKYSQLQSLVIKCRFWFCIKTTKGVSWFQDIYRVCLKWIFNCMVSSLLCLMVMIHLLEAYFNFIFVPVVWEAKSTFDYRLFKRGGLKIWWCAIKNSHSVAKIFEFLCARKRFSHHAQSNIAKNMLMHCWFNTYNPFLCKNI